MITRQFSQGIRRLQTRPSSTARPMALPRLPVPALRSTLDRYLQSIQPILLEDEARGGPCYQVAYDKRVRMAAEFEAGVGKVCQEHLLALDKTSPHNWLDDNFWLNAAYLDWRAPLLINSNWWLAFHNDEQVPKEVLAGQSSHSRAEITPWQVRRAAWLVHRTLAFKEGLDTRVLYPGTTRTGIWLRESVAKIFNTGRIPRQHRDVLSPPSMKHPGHRQLLVLIHDWFYTVDIYDERHSRRGASDIESRLRAVVRDVEARLRDGEEAVPIGILSADNRDIWAQNLEYLLSLSPVNQRIHQTILNSLFALSLDSHTNGSSFPLSSSSRSGQILVDSPTEVDAHLHNIRSSQNAHNRWFDKTYTIIVETNSRAGANGEHAPVDALVPSIVAEYAVVDGINKDAFVNVEPSTAWVEEEDLQPPSTTEWQRLDWVVDNKIRQACIDAEGRAKALIENSDNSVLWFNEYGTDWIKAIARLAPDAYLQMVLQLAWYKARGEFTATYETALTRMFQHGRTETIRTLTADSRAFVLSMVDSAVPLSTRLDLLRRAVQTHVTLTREAATGRGIDRHLLGLRLVHQQHHIASSAFLNDELFERSQQWKLSTSGLSAGHQFRGTGFGASYNDGYGINYLAAPHMVKFGIETKSSSPFTSTDAFKAIIVEALMELKDLCLFVDPAGSGDVLSHL